MNFKKRTETDLKNTINQQVFLLENNLAKGNISLSDVGDLIPGSVMVQDISALQVVYMNELGCKQLNHSLEQINEMGTAYYEKFLVPEETSRILPSIAAYFATEGNSKPFSFFQQVRTGPQMKFEWYFTTCKFLSDGLGNESTKLIVVSNLVAGMGFMVNKVSKALDEHAYVAKNYKKFGLLTRREKEIVGLLAEGKTTKEISDMLYVSHHTVSTHRKNICAKLQVTTFSALLKFATAFELVK